ncbi:MAG: hexose kinase [Thermomicrobiales bacterium]|nr:hexose kinase [Thermomicrobiales bacterium]
MSSLSLLSIGVNAATDVYYRAPSVALGGVNRVELVRSAPGGKGINLARAFARLGGEPVVSGIVGGESGSVIESSLASEGIPFDFVHSDIESRRTVTIVTPGETTVFLEPGGDFPSAAYDELIERVSSLVAGHRLAAIAGSLPPTAPAGYLSELVRAARMHTGVTIAVDTAGPSLEHAIAAGVDLIKVNADELGATFGIDARDLDAVATLFARLQTDNVSVLCVTDGENGAVFLHGDGAFHVSVGVEHAVSTVGAGDAFLAGLLYAIAEGRELREAARLAAASGAAATQVIGAGFIDRTTVERHLAAVEITPIDVAVAGQAR